MDEVTPETVDGVAAVLREAAGRGYTVLARGAGTKLHWGGPPPECDLVVDLRGLDRTVDHAAGDMVVQVQAGVTLDELASTLARAGQQLAVDVPGYDDGTTLAGGTVGGALAVGLAGPRCLRYGQLRDLLLGVRMVRADGVVASSGGRVVKNVAGYDLGKLLCGSYGTLGVIVEATLRLHPLPAATGWVSATWRGWRAGQARTEGPLAGATAVADSQLAPSAVELDRPGPGGPVTVVARFEGTRDGVAGRLAAAAALTGGEVVAEPPAWFGRWPGGPSDPLVRVACLPAGLGEVLTAVDAAAAAARLPVHVRGGPGQAELAVGLPATAPPESLATFLSALRPRLATHQGSAVVVHGSGRPGRGNFSGLQPGEVSTLVWGPVDPGALVLMRRVKDQFDPDHRLSPGRFVAGI